MDARRIVFCAGLSLVFIGGWSFGPRAVAASVTPGRPDVGLLNLPLRFEPNRGQMDERVRFLARGPGYGLYLTAGGATLSLQRKDAVGDAASTVVSVRLAGGRRDVEPVASDVQPGVTNYFIGHDPARWRTHLEGYGRVRYPAVLPGVDLVYHGSGQRLLEYDVELAPGADPTRVAIVFEGARAVRVGTDGSAILDLPGGELVQHAPVAYQLDGNGRREPVVVNYAMGAAGLGFAVGPYDRARTLVIDPIVAYSTYLGGSGGQGDQANGVVIDSAGDVIVVGSTASSNFPGPKTIRANNAGGTDGFMAALNPSGSALVYATYLGGSGTDTITGITIAPGDAFAYVTGETSSTDFPMVSAFQPNYGGGAGDAFLAQLDPLTGATMAHSTYFGGNGEDRGQAIASAFGNTTFFVGFTTSTNFPMLGTPFQTVTRGGKEVFVARFEGGFFADYSTYIGGSQDDTAAAVAVNAAGEAIVVGTTASINTPGCSGCQNFPTVAALQPTGAGFLTTDAFVTKVKANGSGLIFSTYLGGTGNDQGTGVATDSAGNAYVTGTTTSSNFPTASALQPSLGAPSATNGFVSKIGAAGTPLVFSTYLGGSMNDTPLAITLGPAGHIFVAGRTSSTDFPLASPSQPGSHGLLDAFVSVLQPNGASFFYSTYLGGFLQDGANAIAVDASSTAYVVGFTSSADFPTVSPLQATLGSPQNAFVTKLALPPAIPATRPRFVVFVALFLLGVGAARLVHGRTSRRV
jgi:hypothetical protein